MKYLTIALNVIAIFLILWILWGDDDIGRIIFAISLGVLLPILNIYMLLNMNPDDDLVSLWIKVRKKRLRDHLE